MTVILRRSQQPRSKAAYQPTQLRELPNHPLTFHTHTASRSFFGYVWEGRRTLPSTYDNHTETTPHHPQ